MPSFKLCVSPPSTRLQMPERGPDLSGSALMEQIRRRSSELRRRKREICVTLAGPGKTKKSKSSSPADTRTTSPTKAAVTEATTTVQRRNHFSTYHRFHVGFFTIRLTVCSSFSTNSTFFWVVREARTALWLLQASLALSYESLAVMNFRQEFPTRCQLSPHTFSASDGGEGERTCSLCRDSGARARTPAYPVRRCTPGCEAPTGSSGPRRSSCSWFSCCTRTTGCPSGRPRTPPRPPETCTKTRNRTSELAELRLDSHNVFIFLHFSAGNEF